MVASKFFLAHPFSLDYFPLYQGNHGISSANGKHADFCECTKEFQISNNHFSVSVLAIPPSRYHTLVDNYVLLQF